MTDLIAAAREYVSMAQKFFDGMRQVKAANLFSNDAYVLDGYMLRGNTIDTIIINGCGGTGGWFIPKLAKIMIDAHAKNKLADQVTIYLCDGDNVSTKNLIRQNFIMRDVGKNKAEILANRYSQMFPANVNLVFVDKYIANEQIISAYPVVLQSKFVDIMTLPFAETPPTRNTYTSTLVFNFVDNALSRKCIHNYFSSLHRKASVVVDTGNNLYNGQMNISCYDGSYGSSLALPSNYFIRNFEELDDNEFVKLENCADADLAVNNPEQMFNVNDFAATVTANMANCLFADSKIYYGLTKFVTGKSIAIENSMPLAGLMPKDNTNYSIFVTKTLGVLFAGGHLTDMERTLVPDYACGPGRYANGNGIVWNKHHSDMIRNSLITEMFQFAVVPANKNLMRELSSHYITKLGDFSGFVNAKKQQDAGQLAA